MKWDVRFAIHVHFPTKLGGVDLSKSSDFYEISSYKRAPQPIKSDSLPLPQGDEGQG